MTLTTEEIANINYLVIILIMNLIGVFYFYFSPARRAIELRPSVNCFMIMFALIAAAFVMFAARIFIPDWLSLTLTNGLFLLSAYYARRGVIFRFGGSQPTLKKSKIIWINIVLLTVVNTGMFYLYIDNFAMRATITSVNIAIVFYSCIAKIPKNLNLKTDGEKILQFAVCIIVLLTPASAIFYWFEQSFFVYMSTLMFTQAIAVTGLIGAFLTLLMSDLIEDHYHKSVIDPLTGVYNRRFFEEKVLKVIGFTQKSQHGIIMVDIDDFKDINDTFGHAVGDEVLVKFAKIVSKIVRDSDIVTRFGGEEFVILQASASITETQKLAERLCDEVSKCSIETQAGNLTITASFGVSSLSAPDQLESSLKMADDAMYGAKEGGKNSVVVRDP
jgi:diguanylate cyclase (GGDEF)-like protein